MSNQFELRHLKYFLTVAEESHFRKASEKLFITQPGLSRQIKQLEDMLGVRLLDRNSRNVSLTTAGAYLKKEASQLLNQVDLVARNVKLINQGDLGELRIGFVGSAMQQVIPSMLVNLSQKFPNIHTTLEEMSNQLQVDAIEKNELDIGFVRLKLLPPEIIRKTILKEQFCVVLPQHHHLNETNFKHVGQLQGEKFILFKKEYSSDYYEKVISICEDQGFSPKVSHRTVHASTIFRLVENDLGISIVPKSLIAGYDMKVKALEIKGIRQKALLSMIWKKESKNTVLHNFLSLVDQSGLHA